MPDSSQATAGLGAEGESVYERLGARPVINAAGAYTILGGSSLSPSVRAAMEQANDYFVDMKSLLATSGEVVAGMLGAEAACITAGAAAALSLAAAACLTLHHPDYMGRLPDSSGIANEILTQKAMRQKYDRCLTLSGARLVEYGSARGTTIEELHTAIGPRTAALHYFVPPSRQTGVLSLEDVIRLAHERSLPVIVDAAGHTYPVDELRRYARMGADLVCYAGKYFDAPHSTGLLVGRADLIRMAELNGFIGFETGDHLTIGRPMKVDRQEIVATAVALQEWLDMDHEERLMRYGARCDAILQAVGGLPSVREAYRISQRETPAPVVRDGVRIHLTAGCSATEVFRRLRDGRPSIWVKVADEHANALQVSTAFFRDEDLDTVTQALKAALS